MWRAILEPVLLFLSPFLAYAIYLVLRRTRPFGRKHWPAGTISGLTLAGLAVAAAGMLALGILTPRHKGVYAPAHVENGRLVPGHWE
jgi:hypothetical protein